MGKLDGKVAVVSGGARGQGRAHATTLAREGASVVVFDVCEKLEFPLTPGSTEEQLAETATEIESYGRRCLTEKLDARDLPGLTALADRTMEEFGRLDILVVNHGLWSIAPNSWELEEGSWAETIDVMLTGAWKVCKAFIPKMIESGDGGAIVMTGSIQSALPQPGAIAYTAAKHGVAGMMKTLATELGPHSIRVNTINPGGVATAMSLEGGSVDRSAEYWPEWIANPRNVLPLDDQVISGAVGGVLPPQAIADAMLWLVSDEGRFVTGAMIPVDAGWASA
jgi:(+)-trans-carveol dehydrogenase